MAEPDWKTTEAEMAAIVAGRHGDPFAVLGLHQAGATWVAARASGAQVLVAGMQVPPNYGRRYADDFAALFARVAQAERSALLPFLLAGVADGPKADTMFQADRIHPREEAHPVILDNVWAVLEPMLR